MLPRASNWANDRITLSVIRPIDVVVLNCWWTETNEDAWASNVPQFVKSARTSSGGRPCTTITSSSGLECLQQLLKSGRSCAAGVSAHRHMRDRLRVQLREYGFDIGGGGIVLPSIELTPVQPVLGGTRV